MNPTKLGLHFLIFLRFSTQFTKFSKGTILFEISFYDQAPDMFSGFTDRSLVYRILPGKNGEPAIGSPGCRPAPAGVSVGEVGERRRSSPRLDLGPRKGRGGFRRRRSASPSGGGRWSSSSGEVEAGATVWAARLAWVGARGGVAHRGWEMRPMDSSSPRRSSPAPAGGSDRGGQGSGRRPRRGGVVLSRDKGARGLNRWPNPSLLASQVSAARTTSQGSTPWARRRTARGAGALGARGLWARGHGTVRTGWQARRARATCDVAARRRPATIVPMCLALDVFFSKILNRSARSGK
jgi:hypothetical protein